MAVAIYSYYKHREAKVDVSAGPEPTMLSEDNGLSSFQHFTGLSGMSDGVSQIEMDQKGKYYSDIIRDTIKLTRK